MTRPNFKTYVQLVLFCWALTHSGISYANIMGSMVKVFTTFQDYRYDVPWRTGYVQTGTGSAVIISGNRILTNAHVVSNANYIEVQKNGDDNKVVAEIIAISHQADLALLSVNDKEFFEGLTPISFGALPDILDEVTVYGFPEGGENLSVTKGVVSRIEVTGYVHSLLDLLTVQIDAAINPGNSGGPILKDGKIIGIAMQTIPDAENIGYVIPVPIIQHFLDDLKDGKHDGFPEDGAYIQSMNNPNLRELFSIPEGDTGVLINKVIPGSSADGYLFKDDMVLKIDGYDIANDGSILLRPGLRISHNALITGHQLGENLEVLVLRGGEKIKVSFPLTSRYGSLDLIKSPQFDVKPEFVIFGGMIFVPLSYDYLTSWGEDWRYDSPSNLFNFYYHSRSVKNEEKIIINQVLDSPLTAGYRDKAVDYVVTKVNGKSFVNFKDFVSRVDTLIDQDEMIIFETQTGNRLAMDSMMHKKSESELLELYGITSSRNLNP